MENNSWIAIVSSVISGIAAYIIAKANTRPNIERENANHTQVLFNQYRTAIESLQVQIASLQTKIEILKDEYEAEIKVYRDAVYMLESEARRLKESNEDYVQRLDRLSKSEKKEEKEKI